MAQSFQTSFSPSLSNLTDASDRILRSTIEIFIALRLDEIDDSWVQDIWESQVNVNFGFICYHFLTSGMFDKLEIFTFLKLFKKYSSVQLVIWVFYGEKSQFFYEL